MNVISLALLMMIGLSACASNPPKPGNPVSESDLALEQQRLRDIIVFNSKPGPGLVGLREVIASPAFQSLPVDDQFQALTLAAAATTADETSLEQSYLDRAIALPGLGFEDLQITLRMTVNSGYAAGAIKSLTRLARQWPEQMANVEIMLIRRALFLNDHAPRAERLSVLQALYAAHWQLQWAVEPSESWRDLALLLVERGSVREAIDVSTHITGAYVLAAMRADRRFDAVVAAHPEQFEVEAAAAKERKLYQALSDENPKSLVLKVRVLEALLHEQHYAAMLADSDAVIQAIKFTNYPEKLYDDYVEQHSRYFFLRSVALQREGRREEALAQAVDASHEGDINQLINLASLYWALDRPKDALSVLSTIGPARVSSYGAIQLETVRLQAAVLLGDREQIARSSTYLSEHRADAPADYSVSLLATKKWDLAAAYVVSELEDPDLRQDALLDVQEYLPTPGTELETELEARWRSVVARKDVQAAIRKVGRVERYHLEAP
jgi:hypothetical protein